MQPFKYQLTNDTVMVVVAGKPHNVDSSQPNYHPLRAALLVQDWDQVPKHLTVEQAIVEWATGEFTVDGNKILYQGDILPDSFSNRILKMVSRNESPAPLMRGWERLEQNPSYRSRLQAFEFLGRHPGIPFTDDGFILFYKGVNDDFRDLHSGKFDNSPGQKLSMKRNRVSDDPSKPCHFGFHVGSREYAARFGTKVVICMVDPADIVCVPNDCSQQKVRICAYEVVGVDNGALLSSTVQNPDVVLPEPKVDPNEPLVATVRTHTDGSRLYPGETAPKAEGDDSQAVTLPLTGTAWDELNDLDSFELLEQGLDALRKYARHNCLLIGASKLPGGKETLVTAIVKQRGYA